MQIIIDVLPGSGHLLQYCLLHIMVRQSEECHKGLQIVCGGHLQASGPGQLEWLLIEDLQLQEQLVAATSEVPDGPQLALLLFKA